MSRRFGAIVAAGLLVVGSFSAFDADAKRMGGGRSFGKQSQITRQATPPAQPMQGKPSQGAQGAQATRGQTPPSAAAQPKRNWMGPLAGLAAGFGLAALLSHFGLGGALASVLSNVILIALVALVGLWLFRKFANRNARPATAYAHGGFESPSGASLRQYDASAAAPSQLPATGGMGQAGVAPDGQSRVAADPSVLDVPAVPAGFDADAFIRQAKVAFVRLQAAWDAGNLDDIREFTTPEMFAEIKLDFDSRHGENRTDVVQLNADLVGVEDRGGNEYVASVRFHGLLRETQGAAAEPFAEMWNLSRNARSGEGWVLAGIQQLS
ncbi:MULTISPECIES: Tim44 domain-containing protein [Mycetohabitans]|jgi:predicted lipid-binding transport protein (Tim44 family)|nr:MULTISPECIES: TIM44-like domain-containing protein [Mycetohabitans]MCG1047952.1 TIM44-like domain-containing protein [Mycetohabitans sp. B6]